MSERQALEAQCFVMAGGNGTRLDPLTRKLPKPLLALGTDNRLIDPAIIECQTVASSLYLASRSFSEVDEYVQERHDVSLQRAKEQAHRGHGYVLLENRKGIEEDSAEHLIVTPADHLRNFNLKAALGKHALSNADLTIISKRLVGSELNEHDALSITEGGEVRGFKPKQSWRDEDTGEISLGTYIFKKESLLRLLSRVQQENPEFCDVGYHILPLFIRALTVGRFSIEAAWQDMGTIQRYFDGNLSLIEGGDQFPAVDSERAKQEDRSSLISSRATVNSAARVEGSVIAAGAVVEAYASVQNAIVMPGAVISRGTIVHHAIVGENAVVTNDNRVVAQGQAIQIMQ